LIDPHGGSPKQLTVDSRFNDNAAVSPDGRYIVFTSDRTGTPHIWRMDIDGANPKQLTDKPDETPRFSPDGQWVIYMSNTNKRTIWKVPVQGGQPVQLTDKESFNPIVSPDGKQFACYYLEEQGTPFKFAIFSFDDGQPIKSFPILTGAESNLLWTMDGRAIVYAVVRNGVSNLWAQPVDGSAPKQLTNFTSDHIFWFDISRDGRQVALLRGTVASDVVLISDFK
jgi:Tol biopolymer transport system component